MKVAMIAVGSKIKKNSVMLCGKCEVKRKASDLAGLRRKKSPLDDFSDMFRNMGRR